MKRLGQWLRRRQVLGLFLLLASVNLGGTCSSPMTDDARFYVPAAAASGRWLEGAAAGLVRLDFAAFSGPAIHKAFAANREHPPVGKYVMAVGWLVLHHWTSWLDEVTACRFPILLLWAWMCVLVFQLLRARVGPLAALFGALAVASMPRLLFHSHAETLDMPVTVFVVATAAALVRTLEQPSVRNGACAVLLFALALGSKLNAPFFLVGAALFVLITEPPRWRHTQVLLQPLPLVVVALAVVSPLITWALWPWLWHDTGARLAAYLHFHLQHYGIFFYYGGTLYGKAVAPWTAPWVMTALTLPLPLLGLSLAGAVLALTPYLGRVPGARRWLPGAGSEGPMSPRERLGLFALLQALVQLGAVSLPGVPVYGGVKLFLPAFPFLAILAALAMARVLQEIPEVVESAQARRWLQAATFATLLAPGVLGAWIYGSAKLSYYGELAGGVRGATEAGYERQYYDLAYPELAASLNRLLPQGGTVAVLPNPKEYGPHFTRWHQRGELRSSIRLAPQQQAELLVLTHERRWAAYPTLAARYRQQRWAGRHSVAGVPLFSIYWLR